MEKIMSKTNDTSNLATLEDHNTLADTELDVVTGGQNMLAYGYHGDTPAGGLSGIREFIHSKGY
jgi:hypothetical protein